MRKGFPSLLLAFALVSPAFDSTAAISRLRVVVTKTSDLNQAIISGRQLLLFTCSHMFGTLLGELTMVVGDDIVFFQNCNH